MRIPESIRPYVPRLGAVLSGLLLAASFPPLEWKNAAWVALVPLMMAVRHAPPARAMRLGLLAGTVFWGLSISWLRHVTIVGWITLSLYCALYLMPLAALVSWWTPRWGSGRSLPNIALMLLATATWAGFEYIRSHLFTGFAWNPLGATQYRNLLLIQMATWGGVHAVSALVMWVNAAVALTFLRYQDLGWRWTRHLHPELMLGFLAVALAVAHGWQLLKTSPVPTTPLRVSVVQPNIPQEDKWTPDTFDMIYDRLRTLTQGALRAGKPDLLIWPETAVPDDVRSSEPSYGVVYELATNGVPILVGSMDTEWRDEGKPLYYNSSFLFDAQGVIRQGYDKRHLVIFGEYVPLQPFLPFVRALTPIQESFSPGWTSTVFRLEQPDVAFSVLICFEDTVAKLARDSVRNGARCLVNQTNDAWFDPSSASKQHMIQCVFRCVENRVPAIRCANTGVSCCIDRLGRVYDVLDDGRGATRIMGFRASEVAVPGESMPWTFYTRHGDLFAQACAWVGVGMAAGLAFSARVERRRRTSPPAGN
ncbi:MAG: apolipoprotein N-acyltransferase [Verrucomicrobiota bacterium]